MLTINKKIEKINGFKIVFLYNLSKSDKILKILLALSMVGIVGNYLPEYWKGSNKYYDVIFNLSLSYVATFIFYIINVAIPFQEKKSRAELYMFHQLIKLIPFLMDIYFSLHLFPKLNKEESDRKACLRHFIDCNKKSLENKEYKCLEESLKEYYNDRYPKKKVLESLAFKDFEKRLEVIK